MLTCAGFSAIEDGPDRRPEKTDEEGVEGEEELDSGETTAAVGAAAGKIDDDDTNIEEAPTPRQ